MYCKRAYKKYYAQGNVSEADFRAWADRDAAIEEIKLSIDAIMKAYIIDQLREKLNRQ